MWAGKFRCASTRVFPAASEGADTQGAPRRREQQQQSEDRAEQLPEQPNDPGTIFSQFSVGETGQGGGLGARVQKNERALLPEGAKT